VDVHRDEIGLQPRDRVDRLLAVGSGAHHLDVRIARQYLGEHLTGDERVVTDEHADLLSARHDASPRLYEIS